MWGAGAHGGTVSFPASQGLGQGQGQGQGVAGASGRVSMYGEDATAQTCKSVDCPKKLALTRVSSKRTALVALSSPLRLNFCSLPTTTTDADASTRGCSRLILSSTSLSSTTVASGPGSLLTKLASSPARNPPVYSASAISRVGLSKNPMPYLPVRTCREPNAHGGSLDTVLPVAHQPRIAAGQVRARTEQLRPQEDWVSVPAGVQQLPHPVEERRLGRLRRGILRLEL
jgi:hypothetical protein